jgi:hypothetical protein
MVNRGAVRWKSSKQKTVVDSTTEAGYIVALEATKEGVWIWNILLNLGVVPAMSSPLDLHYDNTGDIAQAKERRAHPKNKAVLR